MTFAWIDERKTEWPVTTLCRVLEVSRAGYYAWRSRTPSATGARRETLTEQVTQIHAEVKARYGSPRMHAEFEPGEPNASWVADVTYVPTREGWLYLAVVVDLFGRMVVGWSMAATMTSRLVVDAWTWPWLVAPRGLRIWSRTPTAEANTRADTTGGGWRKSGSPAA